MTSVVHYKPEVSQNCRERGSNTDIASLALSGDSFQTVRKQYPASRHQACKVTMTFVI